MPVVGTITGIIENVFRDKCIEVQITDQAQRDCLLDQVKVLIDHMKILRRLPSYNPVTWIKLDQYDCLEEFNALLGKEVVIRYRLEPYKNGTHFNIKLTSIEEK